MRTMTKKLLIAFLLLMVCTTNSNAQVKWDYQCEYSEGLACVKKNHRYGFIDRNGKLVIPLNYSNAGNFSEGMAYVSEGGKYGFIDKTGKVVIHCCSMYVE